MVAVERWNVTPTSLHGDLGMLYTLDRPAPLVIASFWSHSKYVLGQLGPERNGTPHDTDTRDQTLEQVTLILLY